MENYTWRQWWHGLVATLIGGLSPFGTIGAAAYFQGSDLDWKFWKSVAVGAFINGWIVFEAYRKQFPPPGILTKTVFTETDSVKKTLDGSTITTAIKKTETTERSAEPVTVPKET